VKLPRSHITAFLTPTCNLIPPLECIQSKNTVLSVTGTVSNVPCRNVISDPFVLVHCKWSFLG
jgi:hypothetical protein